MKIIYENLYIPPELELSIRSSKAIQPYFRAGFDGIKPKNYCGFFAIDTQNYFIAPKITHSDRDNLDIFIYMLIYVYDIPISNPQLVEASSMGHRVFELFIRFFADTLLKELKRGVFKSYITKEENLKSLKGKYLVEKNLSNFYNQNIYCEFDEFSEDNLLNQFFLYAIGVFKHFSNYKNLHRCEMMLSGVAVRVFEYDRFEFVFDRMSQRYKESFDVAMVILKRLTPLTDKRDEKSFGFLFDMGVVFEKFVAKLYQEIYPDTQIQSTDRFNDLHLKPDIITPHLIIDTKYKNISKDGIKRDDKYQMFVYGINFDIEDTMLLYPKHLVDIDDRLRLGEKEKMINMRVKSLDLGFDGGYRDYIEVMRERIKEI